MAKKISVTKQSESVLLAKVTGKLSKRDLSLLEDLVTKAFTRGYVLSEITLERCSPVKSLKGDFLDLERCLKDISKE